MTLGYESYIIVNVEKYNMKIFDKATCYNPYIIFVKNSISSNSLSNYNSTLGDYFISQPHKASR